MLSEFQSLTYGPDLAKNRAWAVATGLGSRGTRLGLSSAMPLGCTLICLPALAV